MIIATESERPPTEFTFDAVIAAVGFEKRCRWVIENHGVQGRYAALGLEFGFLTAGSYDENRRFFEINGFQILNGLCDEAVELVSTAILRATSGKAEISVLVDISSMSREMIANVTLALKRCCKASSVHVYAAYAPSKFSGEYKAAPIRRAAPITADLAGWSATAERPVGAIFGLGCEPGLALGALQFLEPNKAWTFSPKGVDERFEKVLRAANQSLGDIFDVTEFEYDITHPALMRSRLEVLLNSVDRYFRLIIVPFGPKLFAWVSISTVVFESRRNVGVWAFSSKEEAQLVDRQAEGPVIWHQLLIRAPSLDAG